MNKWQAFYRANNLGCCKTDREPHAKCNRLTKSDSNHLLTELDIDLRY
jgi:hypothetical protein